MDITTLIPTVVVPSDRRTVVNDAHMADIRGALGALGQHATRPRSRRRRLFALRFEMN
jgi:hypothetical protein